MAGSTLTVTGDRTATLAASLAASSTLGATAVGVGIVQASVP